jgi:hypothetical protein
MTLPFKTEFPWGEKTLFIYKIWMSIIANNEGYADKYSHYRDEHFKKFDTVWDMPYRELDGSMIKPKHHTIRHDNANLWSTPGRIIHPVINNRTKNRFQFTPEIPVKSTQHIEIKYINKTLCIGIDDKELPIARWDELAMNDGFNPTITFLMWFRKNFEGTIIHWTNLKY